MLSRDKRVERSSIPLQAARELLVNAVVHADYSQQGMPIRVAIFDDRMEIENPGVLLSGLTVPDIEQGYSKLRNRVLARVFKELRYIEQRGSGILKAIAECRKAGLPDPVFEELAFRFRATLRLIADRKPDLDKVTQAIRQALLDQGGGYRLIFSTDCEQHRLVHASHPCSHEFTGRDGPRDCSGQKHS